MKRKLAAHRKGLHGKLVNELIRGGNRIRIEKKKLLSQRWHQCACGIGPVQRDLYSAFLLAYIKNPTDTTPSISQSDWEGVEARLRAEIEALKQRAKEGQVLPGSFGIPRAGARRLKSLASLHQELSSHRLQYRKGRIETVDEQ